MKNTFSKRILAAAVSAVMLLSSLPSAEVSAANVEETPGIQLQTILIDNNGKNWETASWGGQNLTPNTNWTVLDIGDYYENGKLNFEIRSNGNECTFRVGLVSKKHGTMTTIRWTDMDEYKSGFTAGTDWTSYSLSLKELVDAYPDSEFRLEDFWYVSIGGVPSGTTASLQNVTITSSDDERQYPVIKVNQAGYICNAAKIAKVSCFEKFGSLDGKTYEIVNAESNEAVLAGTLPEGVLEETFSGEMVHTISFDELTEPGVYYIRISDTGLDPSVRSPRDISDGLVLDTLVSVKFEIRDDVYDDLLNDLTKYYYYQRQGIEIEEKYAGVFARENLHPNDVTVKKWSDRNNPDAETFDVSGGWYDAGDYGKYTSPGANSVNDLLFAYEMYPQVFDELEMNIPETDPDNPLYVDAPGILSEVKYELDMLLKLEHSSKDGSFYTAANYSDADDVIYIEDTLYKTSDHESDESERDLRCHLATADMAAVLAHAYIVYRDIPAYEEFAEQCLATSLRSWQWLNDSSNTKNMSIGAANRTYTFKQADLDRGMFQTAGALYRALSLKGEDTSEYEAYLLANCNTESVNNCFLNSCIGYGHSGRSFLGFFHYLYGNENADPAITEAFSQYDTWRTRVLKNDNWGLVIPAWGFWWGSNKYVAQSAMTLTLGDMAVYGEVQEDALAVIDRHFHYLLGVNPISFSYVSGHGENSVENIYSAIYSRDMKLDPYQCPAGYFTEGANNHNNPHLSKFVGKCYIDSDGEYTTNENTIYGNAAMIFLTAAMMTKNKPEEIKGDVNTDGVFSLADAVMLQKWLVCEAEIIDRDAGDVCEDDSVNTLDLCMMKNMLAEK